MQYFTERAASHREALEIIREKYGERAQVLSHRTVRQGGLLGFFAREAVEVTGYLKPASRSVLAAAAAVVSGAAPPGGAVAGGYAPAGAASSPGQAGVAQAAPAGGASFEDEKRRLLEAALQRSPGAPAASPAGGGMPDAALARVLGEIQSLRIAVDARNEQGRGDSSRGAAPEHESIARADALLAENDFPESYRKALVAELRRGFTLEGLEDWDEVQQTLLERIGDSFDVWRGSTLADDGRRGPRVLALVGPTGVGKTTTIAKLAAIWTVGIGGERPRAVRMITLDNYRIGARQQIETYGDIMGVPVSCVETAEDLRSTLALHEDADLVLVDTIGKSPRDAVKLAEMQRIIAACGPRVEVHLALAATTKASDMAEILRQFEPFNYRAVVLTKLDETDRIGNALAVLAERRKPLSYVTTGQKVPQDIERARTTRLLMRLEGFRPDRPRLEARYDEAESGAGEGRGQADSPKDRR